MVSEDVGHRLFKHLPQRMEFSLHLKAGNLHESSLRKGFCDNICVLDHYMQHICSRLLKVCFLELKTYLI